MSRALDLLGVLSPGMSSVAEPKASDPPLYKTLVPGVATGIVGYNVINKHPVLGFFGGETLGQNAYRMYRGEGDDRTRAACNMGSMAAGITGSLLFKKHPFYGFCLGLAAGLVATSFVPGSNAYNYRHKGGK
jgi:hypothetical protein